MTKYDRAIKEARERYRANMNEAAQDALLIAEQYDKPLKTVCKEIAEDAWNALEHRARKLKESAAAQPEELRRKRQQERQRVQRSEAVSALKTEEQRAVVMAKLPAEVKEAIRTQLNVERARKDDAVAADRTGTVPEYPARTRQNSEMSVIDRHTAQLAQIVQEDGYTADDRADLAEWVGDHVAEVTALVTGKGRVQLKAVSR